jgi:hypothetical protein
MRVSTQQWIGLGGVLLLCAGLFMPIVNIPLLGERDFFEVGDFGGMLDYSFTAIAYGLLGLAAASLLLIVLNYCRGLLIPGLIALAVFALSLKQFRDAGKMLHDNVASNFIMNITGTTVDEGNLRWGWIVLLASAVVLMVASFLKPRAKEEST